MVLAPFLMWLGLLNVIGNPFQIQLQEDEISQTGVIWKRATVGAATKCKLTRSKNRAGAGMVKKVGSGRRRREIIETICWNAFIQLPPWPGPTDRHTAISSISNCLHFHKCPIRSEDLTSRSSHYHWCHPFHFSKSWLRSGDH